MPRKLIALGQDPFDTCDEREADVRDVLYAGRWSTPPIPDNRQAQFVLDMQPEEGEFACWAYMRFGGPWIDCVTKEADREALHILRRNVPPSARLIEGPSERVSYDVIHAGECVDEGLRELARTRARWYGAEWNSDTQRRIIDRACGDLGMRLFKMELRDADVGRGLWLVSEAIWVDGAYRMPARDAVA